MTPTGLTHPTGFDEVFRTDGVEVILTPFRSPQANAHAERFVRTVRAECLDWLLILGPRQLDRALRVYVDHTERSAATRRSLPRRRHGDRRSQRSSGATDSADSCTSTTWPQHDETAFWHPSPSSSAAVMVDETSWPETCAWDVMWWLRVCAIATWSPPPYRCRRH
jgi:hypothetical protein